jgi:hypothetical protein
MGLLKPLTIVSLTRVTAPGHGAAAVSTPNPPAPVPETPTVPGLGASASNGGGVFFFAVFAVLGLFALTVPQLDCRFRLVGALGRPLRFVLLLDRPG